MFNFLNGPVSNQIYFVYGLIGVVVVLIVLILILDRREKKRYNSKNLFDNKFIKKRVLEEPRASEVELKPLIKEESIQVVEEKVPEIEPVIEASSIKEEITYVSEDKELEKTQAQLELQRLAEELKKQESEEKNITLTNFELEQEENAIISIQDLMKKSNELYDKNEEIQYMDEGNEPINLEELRAKFKSEEIEETIIEEEPVKKEVILEDFVTEKEENTLPSKFKSSPFISPIYGFVDTKEEVNQEIKEDIIHDEKIELEQTANLEQLDEEIRKTNEFLQVLKELQKNLE